MKIKVSEIFYSAQGEGRFVGVPSVFLRTFGCNFTCSGFGCAPGDKSIEADDIAKNVHLYKTFDTLPLVNTGCDSYASWHPAFKDLSPSYEIDQLTEKLLAITPNGKWRQSNGNNVHLVITGGEPLLGWQRAYEDLISHVNMQDLREITFETNGTQKLQPRFKDFLTAWQQPALGGVRDHNITFSVSPKLSASGESWDDAIKPKIIAEYEKLGVTYLKFVVDSEQHFQEVDQAVSLYRDQGFTGSVYVMPQGGTREAYEGNLTKVADLAMARGYNLSPRLHCSIWGNGWAK